MRIRRRDKGSVIAFSTVLALALVILGVAFVFLIMYMGGQAETKNAVDAGALNVGKQALDDVKVKIGLSDIDALYYDCTSDSDDGKGSFDGNITLRRINRVWAKAMLIGINAAAADKDGQGGSGTSNATQAYNEAKTISDQLATKLTTPDNLYDYFRDYSRANSVRMIGPSVETDVLKSSNWQTSLMDRTPITKQDRESNITVNASANALPPSFSMPSDYVTKTTRNQSLGGNLQFLKGYKPLTVGDNDIWQVPFQYDEKPRLVSRSLFEQSMAKQHSINWTNPVPNAFSVEGQAIRANAASEKGMSWVLTNPHETFQMSMPHSYMKIHLDKMVTKWRFFPTGYPPLPGVGVDQEYDYSSITSQTGVPDPGGGLFCLTVNPGSVDLIGSDVFGRNLDQVIFSVPSSSDTSALEANMTSRFNEMISKTGKNYSISDMHSVLSDPKTIGYLFANQTDLVCYSPDGVNVTVEPEIIAQGHAPWLIPLIGNDPDGTEKKVVDGDSSFAPIFFEPTAEPDPFCSVDFTFGWGMWFKDLQWQPGSGYNHCLGKVHVTRWTEIYSLAVGSPL
jgi:hypothetical protein